MCGIVGKLNFNGQSVPHDLIRAMADTVVYRGPDDEGCYASHGIGLGQRRLAIIDLNRDSTAPLSNEDGSLWIVFNGEIYNFHSLRAELIQLGHTFRTGSDTEVIIHLYEQYGVECLHYLRGMFAFAIWDSTRNILFAARDRLGKKPFYYAHSSSHFIFGSEIKAIMAEPSMTAHPDFYAIDRYLSCQYVPSPLTAFTGISTASGWTLSALYGGGTAQDYVVLAPSSSSKNEPFPRFRTRTAIHYFERIGSATHDRGCTHWCVFEWRFRLRCRRSLDGHAKFYPRQDIFNRIPRGPI